MTTRPRLADEVNWVAGVAALGLFAVLAAVFATAGFPGAEGFGGEGSITASIGYAMFDMTDLATFPSENFLVVFEVIDLVLVAALVVAVMLARRDDGSVTGVLADGGRDRGRDGGDD
ncbi:MAG: proton-conducting membrane transporter [Halorientalis sp.]